MRAMLFEKTGTLLRLTDIPQPRPGKGQLLIKVEYCGICRTDLHVMDGELTEPKLPLVLGHQIVGVVEEAGPGAKRFQKGKRVGVPWLGWTCGDCFYCRTDRENLCEKARYTGYQIDGGMADYCVAEEAFCFEIPLGFDGFHAAPLLCAGMIGYRALKMAGDFHDLGFYGFGSAAHLLTQLVQHRGDRVYAFTKPGDRKTQDFARKLGAFWAGGTDEKPPVELDSALIFAPAGELVPLALSAVKRGGKVVCAGIHMSAIPSFSYDLLWGERSVQSVANLTREDGREFFSLLTQIQVHPEVKVYALEEANQALDDLRHGAFQGSAVLQIAEPSQANAVTRLKRILKRYSRLSTRK